MIDKNFWQGKRVFITGHSGFKGAWLTLLLAHLKAKISGYALPPPTDPSLFALCRLGERKFLSSTFADIRNKTALLAAIKAAKPEIVIHLAAQPLVLASYQNPPETYEVNILGTVNLLEAVRAAGGVKAVINVTTDKCYQNQEWVWGYRETEPLGGYDPYSSSKACSEIITASYRQSFFDPADGTGLATARSGNVFGGGDWASDRLVADAMKALLQNEPVIVRNPLSVRPWQHVLEPLAGYLLLAQHLCTDAPSYSEAWNFGPDTAHPVGFLVETLCALWGENAAYKIDQPKNAPHEAHYLKLDATKAKTKLAWQPKWDLKEALAKTVAWSKAYRQGKSVFAVSNEQIEEYLTGNKNNA
ncbi:MAG: CDP-glucose 4,6-dehydratase [Sporomusaceae bacterium]|jgi:CDP-glucose 4,6-dehydratase|nr:CDP-glucose 4,6-dehydratase [Sporomusaceae bacterium]